MPFVTAISLSSLNGNRIPQSTKGGICSVNATHASQNQCSSSFEAPSVVYCRLNRDLASQHHERVEFPIFSTWFRDCLVKNSIFNFEFSDDGGNGNNGGNSDNSGGGDGDNGERDRRRPCIDFDNKRLAHAGVIFLAFTPGSENDDPFSKRPGRGDPEKPLPDPDIFSILFPEIAKRKRLTAKRFAEPNAEEGEINTEAVRELESKGATVYLPPQNEDGNAEHDWGKMRGYESIKKQVEESLVSVFQNSEYFDSVAEQTRGKEGGSAIPRAVLFYGKPGTGKTLCAQIIARQCKVPLVYISPELFKSKWFGKSEKTLSEIFAAARSLSKNVLIFVDEIDSALVNRNRPRSSASGTEDALLSMFLRQLDGFESSKAAGKLVLIAATNRKDSLDKALLSRFELQLQFHPPDFKDRCEIIKLYARHINDQSLEQLADAADGLTGRGIRDACISAERSFLHSWIKQNKDKTETKGDKKVPLPDLDSYRTAFEERVQSESSVPDDSHLSEPQQHSATGTPSQGRTVRLKQGLPLI